MSQVYLMLCRSLRWKCLLFTSETSYCEAPLWKLDCHSEQLWYLCFAPCHVCSSSSSFSLTIRKTHLTWAGSHWTHKVFPLVWQQAVKWSHPWGRSLRFSLKHKKNKTFHTATINTPLRGTAYMWICRGSFRSLDSDICQYLERHLHPPQHSWNNTGNTS